MRKTIVLGLGLALVWTALPLQAGGKRTSAAATVTPLDRASFAERLERAYNAKDVGAISASMSKLYNDAGLSKAEATAALEKLLAGYDSVETYYRVLDFKQFPGTNLGSIKAVLQITGVPKGRSASEVVVRTFGYASVVFEDGDWRVYGTQAGASGVMNFNPESLTPESWPAWGSRLTLDEQNKVFGLMAIE